MQRMIQGVERIMNARKSGVSLTSDEMMEVFGGFDPSEYAEEAEERWGDSGAYRESARRTAKYGKKEWQTIRKEVEEIESAFAAAMKDGDPSASAKAMDLAEDHRNHISRWFYKCTCEIHRGLGDMYVSDPRFAKHFEDRAPGLSAYVREAIYVNSHRNEGGEGK